MRALLHLQQLTRPGIIKVLIHRAGLNADILNDGRISVGDTVVVHGQPERPTIERLPSVEVASGLRPPMVSDR